MGIVNLHPDAAELEQFARGTLSDALQTVVETHLAECPECQARVEAAGDDEIVALLRCAQARTGPRIAGSPDTLSPIQTPAFITKEALAGGTPSEDPNPLAGTIPEGLANHPRYRVRRLVGRGGMGAVFEAEHRLMNRSVALKVINPTFTANAAAVERFRREVRAAAQLHHPNIVTAFDAEEIDGTHFLVMEYVEGVSLARMVQENGPLPVAQACDFIRQAAIALQHAHEQGMVHRDVKPDNLLRCVDGRIKVVDFGLASLVTERDDGLTDERTVMGTPEFMAPEQAEDARRADTRSDIYSLGCTLFYLLTGRAPYPASTSMLKLVAHREQPVPKINQFRADVPPGLARVLERLLAKRPEGRYSTPGEVANALVPFTKPQAIKPRRRRGLLVALAAVLLLGGSAGVVVYRIQTDHGELVITTDSDDVEVIVKQGGKIIDIIDTKTKKQITLHSGTYELELNGAEGLKLDIDKATLTRGTTVVATVERRPVTPAVPLTGLASPSDEVLRIPRDRVSWGADLSPDGRYFSQMTWGITSIWDLTSGKVVFKPDGALAFFSPDGQRLVSFANPDEKGNCLRLYEVPSWKPLLHFGKSTLGCEYGGQGILPDNRTVCTYAPGGKPRWWDLTSGENLQKPPNAALWGSKEIADFAERHRGQFNVEFVLPGDREVAVLHASGDTTVDVYDVRTDRRVREVTIPDNPTKSGDSWWSGRDRRDRCRLAAVSRGNGTIHVLDLLTGKEIARCEAKTFVPKCLAVSADGRFLAASAHNEKSDFVVWRLPDLPKP